MAVALRLARGGAKKRPFYRIVAADVRAPRDGKYIERIGSFNPLLAKDSEQRVVLDKDRAKYWLDNGAQPSDRVLRLLADAGLAEKPNYSDKPQKTRKRPDKKTRKELKAEADAQAAEEAAAEEAAAAEAAAAEEAAPAEEAPAEEEAKAE